MDDMHKVIIAFGAPRVSHLGLLNISSSSRIESNLRCRDMYAIMEHPRIENAFVAHNKGGVARGTGGRG